MTLLVRWIHFVASKCGDGFLSDLNKKQVVQFKNVHKRDH